MHKLINPTKRLKDNTISKLKPVHTDTDRNKINYISPYKIKNETGYRIEIQRDYTKNQLSQEGLVVNQKKYQLEENQSMNFELDADIQGMFEEIKEEDL